MSSYEASFYIVPAHIRKLPDITLAYLDVYNEIFQFINKGKVCFLNNKSLMERTGLSRRRVQDALNFFAKHKKLVRIPQGSKMVFAVPQPELLIEEDEQLPVESQPTTKLSGKELHGGGAAGCTGGVQRIAPINKEVLNKEIITTTRVAVDVLELAKELHVSESAVARASRLHGMKAVTAKLQEMKKVKNIKDPSAWFTQSLKEGWETRVPTEPHTTPVTTLYEAECVIHRVRGTKLHSEALKALFEIDIVEPSRSLPDNIFYPAYDAFKIQLSDKILELERLSEIV